jgi:hypothetical protein
MVAIKLVLRKKLISYFLKFLIFYTCIFALMGCIKLQGVPSLKMKKNICVIVQNFILPVTPIPIFNRKNN